VAEIHWGVAARLKMLNSRGLIILSIVVYTQFFWTRTLGILPQAANWLDDIVVVGLGVVALLRVPRPARLPRIWAWALAAFVLLGIVSAFANDVPWWRAALGFRGLLVYVPLYYAVVVAPLDEADVWRVTRTLVGLMLLQVPVQLVQFALGAREFGFSFQDLADVAPGTMGPGYSNALGFLYVPFICASLAALLATRDRRWLVRGGLFLVGLVLCSARAATLLLPACLLLTVALVRGFGAVFSRRGVVSLGVALLIGGGLAEAYLRNVTGGSLAEEFSPARLIREQLTYSPTSASRLAYYPVTWSVLTNVAPSPWIGLGPGNYGSGAGYITDAPGFALIRDVFGQFRTNRETALNSQFLATLGEFGIGGILLFFAVILALLARTATVRRTTLDPAIRSFLAAVMVGQVIFLLAAFAEYAWEAQPLSYTFWLCAALVTKLQQRAVTESPLLGPSRPLLTADNQGEAGQSDDVSVE
jgi:hypothetical protein